MSTRLKHAASDIGYSENQFIVESVVGILDVADNYNNAIPRIVVLLRSARSHRAAAPHFEQASASFSGVRRWWGV